MYCPFLQVLNEDGDGYCLLLSAEVYLCFCILYLRFQICLGFVNLPLLGQTRVIWAEWRQQDFHGANIWEGWSGRKVSGGQFRGEQWALISEQCVWCWMMLRKGLMNNVERKKLEVLDGNFYWKPEDIVYTQVRFVWRSNHSEEENLINLVVERNTEMPNLVYLR